MMSGPFMGCPRIAKITRFRRKNTEKQTQNRIQSLKLSFRTTGKSPAFIPG